MSISLVAAFKRVREEVREDPEYAWSWQHNIALAAQDVGVDVETSDKAAKLFVQRCFLVEEA